MYKNKISAVYKITNTITGDCYVGSSKNVMHRWLDHKCPSYQKQHPNGSLYNDMQKYGIENFRFQILAPVEPEHLKQVEQEFIDLLQPTYNSKRAEGWDVEKQKEYLKNYYQSEKGRECQKKYSQSEKGRKYQKKYRNQLCSYNGETLTLNTLAHRFHRAGVKHPYPEAKKYLLAQH